VQQSPSSEVNSHPANQEIPLLLWNPKVYSGVHKNPAVADVHVSGREVLEVSHHHIVARIGHMYERNVLHSAHEFI
jgi:hypothetical protein